MAVPGSLVHTGFGGGGGGEGGGNGAVGGVHWPQLRLSL